MDRQFNTPHREQDQKDIVQTDIKHQPGESQYQASQNQQESREEQQTSLEEQLNIVQNDIKVVQERLKKIAEQKINHDENSQQYASLQDQRRHYRKQLIDLDHKHKAIFIAYKRQRDLEFKRNKEQTEKKIIQKQQEIRRAYEQQRLQRSRRLEEQTREIEQSAKKRRQELNKLYEKHASPPKNAEQQSSEIKREAQQSQIVQGQKANEEANEEAPVEGKQKTQEQKLAQQKYNARIAQIQAQLASQRLRRSRQIQLEAELIRIREWTPYYWYRYSYPSLLYPLGSPYSLYPYHRYPVYDPLLSYPYSLYPYRYRFGVYYPYI